MKPYTKIAAALFGVLALVHLFRLIFPFAIVIADNEVAMGASWAIVLIAGTLSVALWQESKK